MKPEHFQSQRAGKVIKVSGKGYWAFMPNALPPKLNYTVTGRLKTSRG